ncbi:MAG: alpha/beta hydrolase [Actinomycetota bacterium]|nr:alpha/beta hydrolase [Actinomycetota bacterium]
MNTLDDAAFAELVDPAARAVLPVLPDLDPAIGVAALRERGRVVLDDLGPFPMPAGVVREVGESCRVFRPEVVRAPDRAVLWIHGGGMVGGEPRQDDLLCADIAVTHQVDVHSCRYRLAPEDPYPAGLDDCVAALRKLLGGYETVLVAGASAGGGLAIGTAMRARDEGLTGVRGVIAYYPMIDDRPGRASMERIGTLKTWNHATDRWAWSMYLAGLDDVPVYAAPARASLEELRGLPPVALDVGRLDGFFDEVCAFAVALARADVAVDLTVTPGAFHASEWLAPDGASSQRIHAARRVAFARLLA